MAKSGENVTNFAVGENDENFVKIKPHTVLLFLNFHNFTRGLWFYFLPENCNTELIFRINLCVFNSHTGTNLELIHTCSDVHLLWPCWAWTPDAKISVVEKILDMDATGKFGPVLPGI